MEGATRGAAGRSSDRKAMAQDFVGRYTTGDPTEGYSDDEAMMLAQDVLPKLSGDQLQRALQASASNMQQNMKESDRTALAEMLEQRKQGKGMVDITRSGDVVEAGSSGGGGSAAAPDLDDMLGGLLGGGGLGDILDGLLGGSPQGGGSSPALDDILAGTVDDAPAQEESSDGGGLGDMLGDFMGSRMGKTLMAGAAAFAMKELLDQD